MMQFRYLAHVALASALAAGCSSQSLFDDGNGRDDAGSPPDAREGAPDARDGEGTPDGGMVTPGDGGAIPDAPGPGPDAPEGCPTPCFFEENAFDNFSSNPTGANGRWRYVEVQPEADSYVPMSFFMSPDDLMGWSGTGTPAPSLVFCPLADTRVPCVELPGTLALTTTAPDAHHPALQWIAPVPGRYTVTASYRASPDAPEVNTTIMLTLNNQSNVLGSATEIVTDVQRELYVDPTLEAGDVIVLSVIATTETSVAVGMNLLITGPY